MLYAWYVLDELYGLSALSVLHVLCGLYVLYASSVWCLLFAFRVVGVVHPVCVACAKCIASVV